MPIVSSLWGAGEMAQQFRVLVSLAGDSSLVPSIHKVAHNCP